MRQLDIILDILSYEGAASNDPQDADKLKTRTQISGVSESWRLKEKVATLAVDKNIPLPDPSSDLIVISGDREISIKLNGSSDSLTLTPKKAGCKGLLFFMKGEITELLVSNAGTEDASLDIFIFKL